MMDFRDNLEKSQQYINALEEERKKIQVFQRELPLCVELVSQGNFILFPFIFSSPYHPAYINYDHDLSSDKTFFTRYIPLIV